MRKLLTVLGIMLATVGIRAQISGLGFGYNVNFLSPDSLNFVIDRYNETRNFLDIEMEHVSLPKGFVLNLEGGTRGLFYQTGYNWIRQRVFAEGTDASNTLQRREVRLKMDTYHFGLGTGIARGGAAAFLGGAIELGQLKAQTRVGPKDQVKSQKWQNAVKEFNFYLTVFGQILVGGSGPGARLAIEPYYRFGLGKNDYSPLNAAINPNTAGGDPSPLNSALSSFGMKLMLVFLISG